MPIYLEGETIAPVAQRDLDDLTPREIVAELDKYVIGQTGAKKAVAIALRSRIRRQKLDPEIARDVLPKNILMIGSTGVGKTEIARRLARLVGSPFIKIEASKFTEVGYVGRDVESMIRDLVEIGLDIAKQAAISEVRAKAAENVEERILDLLFPGANVNQYYASDSPTAENAGEGQRANRTREKLKDQLKSGELDNRIIEIEVQEKSTPMIDIVGGQGIEEMGVNFGDMLGNLFPKKTKRRKLRIADARDYLLREEQEELIDMESVTRTALSRTETSGIIFLDEIDKIAGREAGTAGPDVSREGVQRDLLPIVEGTTVNTRHGMVNTEHILFIAAGAFHVSKPSDLIPELQGRFPIRVELEALTIENLKRILTQPRNSLIKQYQALLKTEGITLEFTDEAISTLAGMTAEINRNTENIGARRLHALVEKLLEDINFAGAELTDKLQVIDDAYVKQRLQCLIQDQSVSQYIL
jgi:ATP-dependent HslUV protease ATP-binding subunit HslU